MHAHFDLGHDTWYKFKHSYLTSVKEKAFLHLISYYKQKTHYPAIMKL